MDESSSVDPNASNCSIRMNYRIYSISQIAFNKMVCQKMRFHLPVFTWQQFRQHYDWNLVPCARDPGETKRAQLTAHRSPNDEMK